MHFTLCPIIPWNIQKNYQKISYIFGYDLRAFQSQSQLLHSLPFPIWALILEFAIVTISVQSHFFFIKIFFFEICFLFQNFENTNLQTDLSKTHSFGNACQKKQQHNFQKYKTKTNKQTNKKDGRR